MRYCSLLNDPTSRLLLDELQNPAQSTLWFADEGAADILTHVAPHPQLTLVSNRFDIYQSAQEKNIHAVFSDFNSDDYPEKQYKRIVFRVPKEKALINHLLDQACKLLTPNGELFICGLKQEGIKSTADKLKRDFEGNGKLKKQGQTYSGSFTFLQQNTFEEEETYPKIQEISIGENKKSFYSKPGVFGWKKIDQGTELLLSSFDEYMKGHDNNLKNVLDLGCGYGWIFMNLDHYGFESITATDNNAAAIIVASHNAKNLKTPVNTLASDCGYIIKEKFDLVLCNPPFHKGFQHNKSLTEKFIKSARDHLQKTGIAFFVVNEFVGLETIGKSYFSKQEVLEKSVGFKVIRLEI